MQVIHKMPVTEYIVLVENSTNALCYSVMQHLNSGWQPHGSMTTAKIGDAIEYIQPMVKFKSMQS